MTKGCPHCGKVPYPAKNEDGTINWKNIFRIDWFIVFLVIGIIFMLLGFRQISDQCYEIMKDPCETFKNLNCANPILSANQNEGTNVFPQQADTPTPS